MSNQDDDGQSVDSDQPAPSEEPARKSVTVTLPSERVIGWAAIGLVIVGLAVALGLEVMHSHHLSTQKSKLSVQLLQAQAGSTGGDTSLEALRSSAVQAATAYTVAFATYNYQHLQQDFAVTEAHAVDPFLTQYKKETAQIEPDLVKLKSISTGKVLSAAAASVTSQTAVVDLFLDQTIINSASSKPRLDPQRVQMSLARQNGTWVITKVTLP